MHNGYSLSRKQCQNTKFTDSKRAITMLFFLVFKKKRKTQHSVTGFKKKKKRSTCHVELEQN